MTKQMNRLQWQICSLCNEIRKKLFTQLKRRFFKNLGWRNKSSIYNRNKILGLCWFFSITSEKYVPSLSHSSLKVFNESKISYEIWSLSFFHFLSALLQVWRRERMVLSFLQGADDVFTDLDVKGATKFITFKQTELKSARWSSICKWCNNEFWNTEFPVDTPLVLRLDKDAYGKKPFFSWTEVYFNHAVKLHDYWFVQW